MTPDQCRAARAILHWKRATLAEAAKVSIGTIARLEDGIEPHVLLAESIERALCQAGVEFVGGAVKRREDGAA